MKAKRLFFERKLTLATEEVELPERLQSDQVLVQNIYSMISPGTELSLFTGTHRGFSERAFAYAKYPHRRPGYATVGRIMKTGDGVQVLKAGDIVFDGAGHDSHSVHAAAELIKVPEGIPLEQVPVSCSLARVALGGFVGADFLLGRTVAVYGQGIVGNLAMQWFNLAGARMTIVVDTVAKRLEISRTCGASAAINAAGEDPVEKIVQITGGAKCSVVIEATGDPRVIPLALKSVAPRGELVLLGSPRGKGEVDYYFDLHKPGVRMVGSVTWDKEVRPSDPRAHELIFDFTLQGRLKLGPLLTHVLPVASADEAYRGLLEHKDQYLMVLLDLQRWE